MNTKRSLLRRVSILWDKNFSKNNRDTSYEKSSAIPETSRDTQGPFTNFLWHETYSVFDIIFCYPFLCFIGSFAPNKQAAPQNFRKIRNFRKHQNCHLTNFTELWYFEQRRFWSLRSSFSFSSIDLPKTKWSFQKCSFSSIRTCERLTNCLLQIY